MIHVRRLTPPAKTEPFRFAARLLHLRAHSFQIRTVQSTKSIFSKVSEIFRRRILQSISSQDAVLSSDVDVLQQGCIITEKNVITGSEQSRNIVFLKPSIEFNPAFQLSERPVLESEFGKPAASVLPVSLRDQ